MTSKQALYLDLCKSGYNLKEIVIITQRSESTILATLRLAVNKPCRNPQNCRSCPFQISCAANLERVIRLTEHRKDMPRKMDFPSVNPAGSGRYQY